MIVEPEDGVFVTLARARELIVGYRAQPSTMGVDRRTQRPARIPRDDRAGRNGFRHHGARVDVRSAAHAQWFRGRAVHDHGTNVDYNVVLDDDVSGDRG